MSGIRGHTPAHRQLVFLPMGEQAAAAFSGVNTFGGMFNWETKKLSALALTNGFVLLLSSHHGFIRQTETRAAR